MSDETIIPQIDAGLKRLYELKKVDYTENMFIDKCEENGFDDETICDELEGADPADCQLDAEFFDGMFPWIPGDDATRIDQILSIVRECKENHNAFANEGDAAKPLEVSDEHWKVEEEELEAAKEEVKRLAPSIFEGGFATDEALCRMITISKKTGKKYMQYLVDMFSRESLYDHFRNRGSNKTKMRIVDWKLKNPHFEKLRNMDPKFEELTTASIGSYLHRVAPGLMLKAPNCIVANLENVAQHIEGTINFVHHLAVTQKQNSCPFQYDAVFVFGHSVEEMDDDVGDGGDDDDDDGGDDDDDDDGDEQKKCSVSKFDDDIAATLTERSLEHVAMRWATKGEQWRGLKEGLDRLRSEANKEQFYPRENRFCSLMDFRKTDDEKENDLFMFHPPSDRDTVHRELLALNYFHNSRVIIPPKPQSDDEKKEELPFGSKTAGPHFTLSFHVDSSESMRCYLFVNGQCSRFMAPDIKMVLPIFFEKSEANQEYVAGEKIDELIKGLNNKLQDYEFRAFLKANNVKCPWQQSQLEKEKNGSG